MTIATRATALLGIRHPVVLAPMDTIADGRLAAAVTGAGGLGIIGGGYGDEAWLRRELAAAGDARVGVGFITWRLADRPGALELALERRPPAVMLSFAPARPYADRIKRAGAVLICQVQSVAAARAALDDGADMLVAQGAEAGGHGASRGTFALVPAVVDAARGRVPVLAAGGVADGRGLAAALMLGADGVLVGSRFYAAAEAPASEAAKARAVAASGDDTARTMVFDLARQLPWPSPFTLRAVKNAFYERWRGRETELLQAQAGEAERYAEARRTGDFDTAAVIVGEAADLIEDVQPAAAIVERMVAEAGRLLEGAGNRFRVDA